VADFDDIDALLSSSLKSAAEPANSAGVADLIRSRVAAGDAGTSVAGSVAPGWGGGASGFLTIAAPIALIVVAGVVGGSLGASGVFGASGSASGGEVPSYVIAPDTAPIYSCPGGPQIGSIPANTRVLAVARDEDATFLGARNPDDLATTIWFTSGDLVLDEGGQDIDALPVESCPEVTVTEVTPTPTPEPTSEPEETDEPEPPTPSDTTPPVVTKMSANPLMVVNGQSSTISVTASDDVGVTGVTLSWSGPNGLTGSAPMALSSGVWRYTRSHQSFSNGFGYWTFTARASDAAGNLSAPVQVMVDRQYFG
jgi:hypothetical protein